MGGRRCQPLSTVGPFMCFLRPESLTSLDPRTVTFGICTLREGSISHNSPHSRSLFFPTAGVLIWLGVFGSPSGSQSLSLPMHTNRPGGPQNSSGPPEWQQSHSKVKSKNTPHHHHHHQHLRRKRWTERHAVPSTVGTGRSNIC